MSTLIYKLPFKDFRAICALYYVPAEYIKTLDKSVLLGGSLKYRNKVVICPPTVLA